MFVFAAQDFGASGIIVVLVLIAWAVVVLLAAGGVLYGLQLLQRRSSRARKVAGGLLVAVSCLLPIFCYFAPRYLVRLEYGNYPIGRYPSNQIKAGMSNSEVMAMLGPPHERYKESVDGETWIYWIDAYGTHWFGVDFGPDEHVTNTYGN